VSPVKVNAVPMPDLGRDDVLRFCDLARERGFQVRFIEFMPLDGDRAWRSDRVLTGAAVRAMIEEVPGRRRSPPVRSVH
jgi:cyclic pyranopterin phosphate synthase